MIDNRDTPKIQCHILDTGYCLAWEHHLIRGGRHRKVACHSLVALLCHPRHGWILWDTGYAQRIFDATQHFPFALYRHATPLCLDPNLSVINQLRHWKLRAGDIQHIIISHFHADHIAGLRDFPEARLIASENAYTDVATRSGLRALQRAFIPALLPADFEKRANLLPPFTGSALPELGPTHDLFDDGSLLLVSLPGHARGQIGLLVHTEPFRDRYLEENVSRRGKALSPPSSSRQKPWAGTVGAGFAPARRPYDNQIPTLERRTECGRILFAADSCWLRQSIYADRPPSRLTHFFVDDPRAIHNTLHRLHDFAQAYGDVVIIPSHCPEAYREEVEVRHGNI